MHVPEMNLAFVRRAGPRHRIPIAVEDRDGNAPIGDGERGATPLQATAQYAYAHSLLSC
ncbi:MAG: hypothetical protein ABJI59_20290 [Nisaea sp.]|uniref:hypothetical protein n=1 Tax=Nisaea sp. TaxID=2024842 RepID=UPI003297B09F